MHEPTPAAHCPTDLIAEMGSRIAPVGFDAQRREKGAGDLALRRSGKGTVERLKHEAPPAGPRIGRIECIPEIAVDSEIGQSAQEQEPAVEQVGRHDHVSEQTDPIEDAAASHDELNSARGVCEKDMLEAVRSVKNRNAAAELGKVQLDGGVAGLARPSQKRKHKGRRARLPEDIGIEGGEARILERIRGRM